MHIKTALQMLNSLDAVETTDQTGTQLKQTARHAIINKCDTLFPDLVIYWDKGKWRSISKTLAAGKD